MTVLAAWAEGADEALGLPLYATQGAAGADLRANLRGAERAGGLAIAAGARRLVPTGLVLAIPEGWEGQVRMRSGAALRTGLWCPNAPGTVDADFRGEVMVLLANAGGAPEVVRHGDRVAQLVLAPVGRAAFALGAVGATARGAGGFGSTGRAGGGGA